MSTDVLGEDEPREHVRFAAYLHALEQVTDDDELALVTEVLTDPDPTMAQSVIARHLDGRATDMLERPEYVSWAQAMARAVEPRPFLVQRLHEWSLFRAISLAQPWVPSPLTGSSNWLQRKIVERPRSTPACWHPERG
ncbi:hypothetical protein [Actinacidiphila oryziradicis]|uniref:Uncharacterized protein n=1 Tax=Actinacidiphila oryziradicis TaxID=2571141 RepID=A0A4U0SRH5_9ACTN|nr:hypothetical protein [Actinacidiphila oryziradicis]TKA10921.1 hypothetical protein FCI23_14990 [Actinacidiphila oryziradicis]